MAEGKTQSSDGRAERTRYRDEPGARVLDLRREGVPFVPVLSRRECRATVGGPRLHVHPGCIEVAYCVRGALAFETPAGQVAFLPGTVFTSRADEPHRMISNPKGLFVYRILVALPPPGRAFAGLSRAESRWLAARLAALPRRYAAPDRSVRTAFERCFAAYDAPDPTPARRSFVLRQAVYDLLLACVAAAEGRAGGADAAGHPDVAEWARRMEADPQADYPPETMSRLSGLSPNVFSRHFKAVAGLPPQAYLKVCRVRRAEAWLREGRLGTAAIAQRLKFCSAQYFATVFKSVTGQTPRACRRQTAGGRGLDGGGEHSGKRNSAV